MRGRRPVSERNDGDAFQNTCKGCCSTESGEKGWERSSIQDLPREMERSRRTEGEMGRERKMGETG